MQFLSPALGAVALLTGIGLTAPAYGQSVFTFHKNGSFYHNLSTLPGAYDLVADVQRSTADPDSLKDFIDTDVAGNFEGKWKAGNATTFVNAPGYPAFNAQTGSADFTFAKIDSLYKAGTPITFQNSPGTGSKHTWIAKLRGGSSYAIVKFLSRIGNNNDCACANMGITGFEYWKMSVSGGGGTAIQPQFSADRINTFRLGQSAGNTILIRDVKSPGGMRALNVLGRPVPELRFPL